MSSFAQFLLRPSSCALLVACLTVSCSSPSQPAGSSGPAAAADSTAINGPAAPANSPLQVVAEFREPQIVGVAVLPDGRVFGDFPRWDDNPVAPIAEIGKDGSVKGYPDSNWCLWNETVRNEPQKHWICPQSVHADKTGMLWVLDPASPGLKGTVPGGPKLVKIDPKTNKVVLNISIPENVASRKSYLNDVRIDTQNNYAYITESGVGSLVVVDLKSGKARKLLAMHPSMMGDTTLNIKADGHEMIDATGKRARFNADGIALSQDLQYLYWKPLTSYKLYRIKTEALRNPALSDAQLAQQIEDLGKVPACDGMEIDAANNLYLTTFEDHSIKRRTPDGKIEAVVQDPRLEWPDTFAFTADGSMYVTTSAIHKTPTWNKGVGKQNQPYRIFKLALPK
ncbi:SMP-30/gluconolactonase/LRE family protein [Hymenobacter chitinivorans]|uniref:Sugar lactone lactonase YvrE n=1 Tax=Hymenobacter chitinivorans DSM 11115 TaxID=1121954 RepID=A0A2M9B5K5_9BACT|nr:L-dopachrome tautomerase-related protein [Hymenobacter chitinivorans]PJJ53228.1 sugar lactone lactonase YvrE [Hymenobacter chitinivorans DSM 11115]